MPVNNIINLLMVKTNHDSRYIKMCEKYRGKPVGLAYLTLLYAVFWFNPRITHSQAKELYLICKNSDEQDISDWTNEIYMFDRYPEAIKGIFD